MPWSLEENNIIIIERKGKERKGKERGTRLITKKKKNFSHLITYPP
jgi:hypothetical protein